MSEDKQKPLDYETPPKAPIGSAFLGVIGFVVYAAGLGVCWLVPWHSLFDRMQLWSLAYFGLLAIILGIKYGTQDKDFWI